MMFKVGVGDTDLAGTHCQWRTRLSNYYRNYTTIQLVELSVKYYLHFIIIFVNPNLEKQASFHSIKNLYKASTNSTLLYFNGVFLIQLRLKFFVGYCRERQNLSRWSVFRMWYCNTVFPQSDLFSQPLYVWEQTSYMAWNLIKYIRLNYVRCHRYRDWFLHPDTPLLWLPLISNIDSFTYRLGFHSSVSLEKAFKYYVTVFDMTTFLTTDDCCMVFNATNWWRERIGSDFRARTLRRLNLQKK